MSQTENTPSAPPSLPTGSPCWIEIPALDVSRAKQFYTKTFNFTINPPPPTPTPYTEDKIAMFTMPGCNEGTKMHGGIVKKEGKEQLHRTKMVYLWAKDLEEVKGQVEKEGGKLVGETYKEGDFGLIQEFEDTEGNLGGLYTAVKK